MIKTELTLPELGLLVGTRGMLGAGLGLLLAHKLSDDRRKGIGWTLAVVGVLSTIPLALMVFGDRRRRTGA
ncbi:MAG TPA: hypothetical protein VN649_21890 [Ramlibacter sp.]|nr:hypothetical protein [Ramlibacter sp.]